MNFNIIHSHYQDNPDHLSRFVPVELKQAGAELIATGHTSPAFPALARRAFDFMRTHGGAHYSPSTLMRILHASDMGSDAPYGPTIFAMTQPHSYDPDTEVKRGGVLGMLVQLNDGQGRGVGAVNGSHRRQGIGSALLRAHCWSLGEPAFWLGRGNCIGQKFMLSHGFQVQQMNARGALRFASADDGGDE